MTTLQRGLLMVCRLPSGERRWQRWRPSCNPVALLWWPVCGCCRPGGDPDGCDMAGSFAGDRSGDRGWFLLFTLVDAVLFQFCLAKGLQGTGAGLGSVLIDSQPLIVALLARWLFAESINPIGWIGLVVGLAGIVCLGVPAPLLQHWWLQADLQLCSRDGSKAPAGCCWQRWPWPSAPCSAVSPASAVIRSRSPAGTWCSGESHCCSSMLSTAARRCSGLDPLELGPDGLCVPAGQRPGLRPVLLVCQP